MVLYVHMDSSILATRLCVTRWLTGVARLFWTRRGAVVLLGVLLGLGGPPVHQGAAQPTPGENAAVGLALSDSSQAHREAAEAVMQEVRSLMGPERRVEFPERYRRMLGTGTGAGIGRLGEGDAGPAVVIAVGLAASHRLATSDGRDVPVVAAHVLDPDLQDLPAAGDASGAATLTYVT
jgi:hypothetical protein